MRFLIDNAMSPEVAAGLNAAGHDALHVRDLGLADAADVEIFHRAAAENCVIVSADRLRNAARDAERFEALGDSLPGRHAAKTGRASFPAAFESPGN
jgi:hypothetical protein